MRQTWEHASPHVSLQHDECHIWLWPLFLLESASFFQKYLDPSEIQRAERFVFAKDRAHYTLCHVRMRQLLAGYAGIAEADVRYRLNPFGKPELETNDRMISFSLSHTATHALLAVVQGSPVGADIERVRPITPDVATANFSAAEMLILNQISGEGWLRGFYRCWTRKEAVLKAEGVGLNVPLNSFDVEVAADRPAALVTYRSESGLTQHWQLHDVSLNDSVVAAVALTPQVRRLRCFYWDKAV